MCGRYTIRGLLGDVMDVFAPLKTELDESLWRPRYNVAPSQDVAVVRLNARGERVLGLVRWGLVPSWTRDTPKVRPINARSETAPTSGMFRQALARRRCLVPADGFFEWQVVSSKVKQPYFFTTNTGLFAFAGIWERWTQPGTETPVDTCAILTTDANDVVKPVHARMPVILQASDHARWIDRETPEQDLPAMLRPFPAQHMQSRAVSRHVNAPANDDEACIVTSEAS